MKVEYTLGFMFSADLTRVVLIHKNKPAWQHGKLNGVGGKIDLADNSTCNAMAREFVEETGLLTAGSDWRYFAEMSCDDFRVHCFTIKGDVSRCKTQESEPICAVGVSELPRLPLLSNVTWLVHLALDCLSGGPKRPKVALIRY